MHSIITSYLLQSKECVLPGIGSLKIKYISASADVVNKQILPPKDEIVFSEKENINADGLLKYIAKKKITDVDISENLLKDFCKEWKERINGGEELRLDTVGSLKKNSEGNICFEEDKNFNFLQPIPVEKVYEKEEPVILAQPAETLAVEDTYQNEPVIIKRSAWGILAIILIAVASAAIFYNFYEHKLTSSFLGNQNHFFIDSADSRYTIP